MENRVDASLEILSIVPTAQLEGIEDYLAVKNGINPNLWEVVVKYNGDIERVARSEGGYAQLINNQFAALVLPKERIRNLLNYTEIEYIEIPKNMLYAQTSMSASCITTVQNNPPYQLKGKGVLLAIIDSGINYFHPDFRNEDGTTRIEYLWDQSIPGDPPQGFLSGTQYTRAQINEALRAPSQAAGLTIVPSRDTVGHGTHVAGIAGGNGRGSNGRIIGAAPEADFLIVKLGQADYGGFVRNVEIMLAIRYVLEKAQELLKPVVINISIGMTNGSHDGNALIEQYMDDAATVWKNNIVVGMGNEGNARNHTSGRVENNKRKSFQFQISDDMKWYNLSLWHNNIDEMAIEISDPSGRSTPIIYYAMGATVYTLGETQVYTSFAGPSPLSGDIEFALFLVSDTAITSGPWTVIVYGEEIVDGRFDVWGPTTEEGGRNNYFLSPVTETTLTTPSTARLITSVGAYNHSTGQIAPFSGRGFGRNNEIIKPDLVAPGVEISAASHTNSGYRTMSGTSMATPHVTGGIALMMQWGIVERNNPFLYGENLKTYLLRGATREETIDYPSPIWGYGKMCINRSLDLLRRQQTQQTSSMTDEI